MVNNWDVQPLEPPPSRAAYLDYAAKLASAYAPVLATMRRYDDGHSGGPLVVGGPLGGVPGMIELFLADPMGKYVDDHKNYVAAQRGFKQSEHHDSLFRKAIQENYSYDMGHLSDISSLAPGSDSSNPTLLDIELAKGMNADSDSSGYTTVSSHALRFKKRKAQTPPVPKPEVVKAKQALRAAKTKAKVEAIQTKAEMVVRSATVKACKVRTDLTYAQALQVGKESMAKVAGTTAAATINSRVSARREKVEAKRVPLYNGNGSSVSMPALPVGKFLVPGVPEKPASLRITTVEKKPNAVRTVVERTTKK